MHSDLQSQDEKKTVNSVATRMTTGAKHIAISQPLSPISSCRAAWPAPPSPCRRQRLASAGPCWHPNLLTNRHGTSVSSSAREYEHRAHPPPRKESLALFPKGKKFVCLETKLLPPSPVISYSNSFRYVDFATHLYIYI